MKPSRLTTKYAGSPERLVMSTAPLTSAISWNASAAGSCGVDDVGRSTVVVGATVVVSAGADAGADEPGAVSTEAPVVEVVGDSMEAGAVVDAMGAVGVVLESSLHDVVATIAMPIDASTRQSRVIGRVSPG